MAAVSKTKKFELLAKMLQKQFKGHPVMPERTVLEHLVYAALLENASFELADAAFAVLENYFIDWNEIRVSTVRELADTFSMLPDPAATGGRVRHSLQGVFEKTYMFDLEELRKKGKNLTQSIEFLREIPTCSRFMVDYTAQVAFGGHLIPLDEASLRIFRLLGLTQVSKEGTVEEVPGLERAIAKKDGWGFSFQLHHFAVGYYANPTSAELRTLLKPIDPEALQRDWTPPVLVVSKSQPKPAPQRPSPVVSLPFAAPDEDDEEEAVGTEAEFLPDALPFRLDDHRATGSSNDEDGPTSKGGKKNKEKKKPAPVPTVAADPQTPESVKPESVKPESEKRSEKRKEPSPTVKPSQPSEKEPPKKETPEKAETAKQDVKLPTPPERKKQIVTDLKKKSEAPKSNTEAVKKMSGEEQATSQKPKPPVAPPKKTSAPKSAPKSDKPPHPKPPSKPTKSSTRQLREKKPK